MDNYRMLRVESVSFDTDNPRIKMALEKYGDRLNAERIHFALSSATDGAKGVSSYSRLKDSIRASGGITVPVTVRVRGDEYVCIDGNTRLAIYKQFLREGLEGSWSEIKAIVLEDANQRGIETVRVSAHLVGAREWPAHFFEVEVSGIGRYAAGLILNREAVRAYIGEDSVPIAPQFPFASEVEDLFGKDEAPLVLDVILDDEALPVTRRFSDRIRFSNGREDHFTDFERIDIPAVDGNGYAATGWVAHSSYRGVIPKDAGIRGIRARAGNIQVGDETIFDHLFPEDRFNRWCTGELHIVDPRIIPNGRRDYFEPGPHIRNLENHLGILVRRIIKRCRDVSAKRNKENKFKSTLHEIEEMYDLAAAGYLSPEGAKTLVGQALERIQTIKEDADTLNGYTEEYLERLGGLEQRLGSFQANGSRLPFEGMAASEVATYRKVFQALAEVSPSPRTARELMEAVLARI